MFLYAFICSIIIIKLCMPINWIWKGLLFLYTLYFWARALAVCRCSRWEFSNYIQLGGSHSWNKWLGRAGQSVLFVDVCFMVFVIFVISVFYNHILSLNLCAFQLNVCLHGTGSLLQVPIAGFNTQWVAIMLLSAFAQLCVRLPLLYAMLNKTCVVH